MIVLSPFYPADCTRYDITQQHNVI